MLLPTVALTRFAPARNIQHVYKQKKTEPSRYGFKIGQLGLLLCLQEKIEIVDSIDPCPIPNTPQWFAGMINLRGNLLPVFDMKELLAKYRKLQEIDLRTKQGGGRLDDQLYGFILS